MQQSVTTISEKLGIHVISLYNWTMTRTLQGKVLPASDKGPEGWSAADKSTVALKTAGLNADLIIKSIEVTNSSLKQTSIHVACVAAKSNNFPQYHSIILAA